MNAIVAEFWKKLSEYGGEEYFNEPFLAHNDPIFGITTRHSFTFDDRFWDVFHSFPFHICHIWKGEIGPFELRFKMVEGE